MTIKELQQQLTKLVAEGRGEAPVYFDTNARFFDYHMALVDTVTFEEEPELHAALHEKPDPWLRDRPLTDEELATFKAQITAACLQDRVRVGDTCNDCPRVRLCKLAFDPYNTQGDCLYEK